MKLNPGRPKSHEKRKLILESAKCLFLSKGIANVSMNLIAKEAGVSKQTVYSHFSSKENLYCEAVISKLHHYHLDDLSATSASTPIEEVLRDVAEKFINLLHDPQVIAMYRVVIGDVGNNSQINELFLNSGPKKLVFLLAEFIQSRIFIAEIEAVQRSVAYFNILKGEFHLRSLLGLDYNISEQEKEVLINTAIEVVIRH